MSLQNHNSTTIIVENGRFCFTEGPLSGKNSVASGDLQKPGIWYPFQPSSTTKARLGDVFIVLERLLQENRIAHNVTSISELNKEERKLLVDCNYQTTRTTQIFEVIYSCYNS